LINKYKINVFGWTAHILLKSVAANKPDWIYGDWSIFPGIKWKLKNLKELEKNNKSKFQEEIDSFSNINIDLS